MVQRLIWGGIVGGLIAFAWGAFSWMVLPWHETSLLKFTDEELVANVIRDQTPTAGVYLLPNHRVDRSAENPEFEKAAKAIQAEKMRRGPIIFAAVMPGGADPSLPLPYIMSFCVQILAAIVITFLLLNSTVEHYWMRVLFCSGIAVTGGVLCHLPNWIWWGFSGTFTMIAMLDLFFAWFVAGLFIAKLKPSAATSQKPAD